MKSCSRAACLQQNPQPPINFSFNSKAKDKLTSWCRPCSNEQTKAYNKAHYDPIKERAKQLKSCYGITIDQYNEMYAQQNGNCAICLRHQSVLKKTLSVDHCHTTEKVRGLLCNTCNKAIGMLLDDTSVIERAALYLHNSRKES